MAYEIGSRTIRVRLRNTEFDGAEARVEAISVAEYLATRGRGDQVMWDAFVEHLLDWSLTFEGEPLPTTPEGAAMVDSSLGMSLAMGWMEAVTNVVGDIPITKQALETLGIDGGPPVGNGAVEMEVL